MPDLLVFLFKNTLPLCFFTRAVVIPAMHTLADSLVGFECPNAHSVVCTPVCRTAASRGQAHEQARQARAKATFPAERNSRPVKEQPQPQKRQRRSSYGGAWRLFHSAETRGKRSSEVQPLTKLGQRYREPDEEECWCSSEKAKKAPKDECVARASHLGRSGGPADASREASSGSSS